MHSVNIFVRKERRQARLAQFYSTHLKAKRVQNVPGCPAQLCNHSTKYVFILDALSPIAAVGANSLVFRRNVDLDSNPNPTIQELYRFGQITQQL